MFYWILRYHSDSSESTNNGYYLLCYIYTMRTKQTNAVTKQLMKAHKHIQKERKTALKQKKIGIYCNNRKYKIEMWSECWAEMSFMRFFVVRFQSRNCALHREWFSYNYVCFLLSCEIIVVFIFFCSSNFQFQMK